MKRKEYNKQVIMDDLSGGKYAVRYKKGLGFLAFFDSIEGDNYKLTRKTVYRPDMNEHTEKFVLYRKFLRIFWIDTGIVVRKSLFKEIIYLMKG